MTARTRARASSWLGHTDRRLPLWRRLTPPQLFVGSFVTLVALGTVGLRWLPGLYTGAPLGWLDALFTATSAVCVTGLIVVDTATHFTVAGQAFLLVLIQLGGLGMITFTTMVIQAMGKRVSFRQGGLSDAGSLVAPEVPLEKLALNVVRFTLGFELLGALLLYALWVPRFGWDGAAWPALFHSVSAFCNAGFSTFSDSLIGFQDAPATLLVVTLLLVAGGLSFLTMQELTHFRSQRRKRKGVRLSLHSRFVLGTSALLLAGGWACFTVFEWNATLGHLGVLDRVTNGLFLSATPRTAGFNSIDYAAATESTGFLTIILMFIGGSPGSTAGGVKVTTVALIGLVALARVRGQTIASIWGRSIPDETIQRAIGLLVVAFGLVTTSIFLYTWTEQGSGATDVNGANPFLGHMFEAVSAFNTVGLSMGVTATLSVPGKWLTVLLMFVGRVGPLTFVAALARAAQGEKVTYRYAYEDVVVG